MECCSWKTMEVANGQDGDCDTSERGSARLNVSSGMQRQKGNENSMKEGEMWRDILWPAICSPTGVWAEDDRHREQVGCRRRRRRRCCAASDV